MGGILKVPVSEIKAACEVYEADRQCFEKVLMIENIVYPLIVEQQKNSKVK